MRWIIAALLAAVVNGQPLEGPFLLYSDTSYSYIGKTFMGIQDDSTARLFQTRASGNYYVQSTRLYSLESRSFLGEVINLDSSYTLSTIDTAVIKGTNWAYVTNSSGTDQFVAGTDSVEINSPVSNFWFSIGGVIEPYNFVPDLLYWNDSWTYASILTLQGVDGAPSWFCGQIVNLFDSGQDTVLLQADTLFTTSDNDIWVCPIAEDSFAVIHDHGWFDNELSISLVGRSTMVNEVSFLLDHSYQIERVLDAERLSDGRIRVLGEVTFGSEFFLITRNLDSLDEYSAYIDVPSGFFFDGICRVPGYGWALTGQYTNEIRLLRIDTTGEVTTSTGTVVWRDAPYRFDWSRVTADSSGKIFVYYGEIIPGVPPQRRVQYVSLDWSTPLDSRDDFLVPSGFSLAAYPNPFNATVQIEYELPQAADVELSVFNTLGQQVATLFNGRANAGAHTLNWSPSTASGIYFVKFASGDFVTSRKILYVR